MTVIAVMPVRKHETSVFGAAAGKEKDVRTQIPRTLSEAQNLAQLRILHDRLFLAERALEFVHGCDEELQHHQS